MDRLRNKLENLNNSNAFCGICKLGILYMKHDVIVHRVYNN